jgi:hypothetical protein
VLLLRIAALLKKSLREVEAMDADEILWWEAFYAVEPWGFQAWQLLMGRLCQVIAAVVGEERKLDAFKVLLDPSEKPKDVEPMTFEQISGVMSAVRDHLKHGNHGR